MKAKAHQKAGNANWPGLKLHWAHSDTLTLTPSTHLSEGLAQADRRQYQRVGAFQNLASQGISRHTTDHHRLNKGEKTRLNDAEWCWMMLNVQNWRSDHCHMIFCWKWEKVCLISPPGTLPKLTEASMMLRSCSKLQTAPDSKRPPEIGFATKCTPGKVQAFQQRGEIDLEYDVFEWSWVMWGDFCFCDSSLFAPASGGTG